MGRRGRPVHLAGRRENRRTIWARAWYRRDFEVPEDWQSRVVRIEFEAVFHTAEVFINGKKAGGHAGKGYTAFAFDISGLLEFGERNTIAVRADNSFAPAMLPQAGFLTIGRRTAASPGRCGSS
ncbi:MAG: hypothetical protein MZV49_06360 [Rhodopseudomonas palustris]|nr:hypothetical protein [Rhodopseudomonas palustris]